MGPTYLTLCKAVLLWHLGEWIDIVIDDQLPFLDGKYLSLQPSCENEFWPCLLEKAYAKLLGTYENLHWGNPSEAFINLTGGVPLTFDLNSTEAHTYWSMMSSASQDTIMACISSKQSTYFGKRRGSGLNNNNPEFLDNAPEGLNRYNVRENGPKLAENQVLDTGLVARHAYSITDYAKVPFRDGYVRLIRIWNPWGRGEWEGNWSDRCPLWRELKEEDRMRMLRISNDGQFWMSWEDFVQEFSSLIICNQVPDYLNGGDQHKKWSMTMFRGRWTKDNISWNNLDIDFLNKNPLYEIKVDRSDDAKSGVNVVICLMQSSRNKHKYGDFLPIGFILFGIPDSQDRPPRSYLNPEKISSIKSAKSLNVTQTLTLPPGRYGIIPYTTQREYESSFLCQVFLRSTDSTQDVVPPQNLKVRMTERSPADMTSGRLEVEPGTEVPKQENIFRLYATQGSNLYVWDLNRLLNDMVKKEYPYPYGAKFTTDGCREILASVDISRRRKLDAETFASLWKTITQYKDLFSNMDSNRCGYLSLKEFGEIMNLAGFKVHSDLVYQLFARYSDAEGKLSFVDFLICVVRLKGVLQSFYTLSSDGKGAYVNCEMWIQLMM
ncbi:calpain-3-like isoform X2 [Dendropsophus ebraccatus]|uniref:calpain-3-like isoform X2 n=1 Tax=Dendropsophus ebraccatus TaxID=150705 RepID=UPI0038313B9D